MRRFPIQCFLKVNVRSEHKRVEKLRYIARHPMSADR